MTTVDWIFAVVAGVLVAPFFVGLFLILVAAPITCGLDMACNTSGGWSDRLTGVYLILVGLAMGTLAVLLLVSK